MKIIAIFPLCLCLLPGVLLAKSSPDDYVFSTNIGKINWSQGEIIASGKGFFPDVIKDPDDPGYDPSGRDQVRNRAQAKLMARSRAMEDAFHNASMLIMGLQVNNSKKIRDFTDNQVIMGKINGFINGSYKIKDIIQGREPVAEHDSRTGREFLTLKLTYQIFGEKGLLSLNNAVDFSENFINFDYETNSRITSVTNGKVWDGLVVSAPYLKLTPALAPKIYSANGRLVYDVSYVLEEEALKTGIMGYAKTPFNQPKDVSLSFYHCTAISTKTPRGTDIVISDDDADQILSRKKTVDCLRHCRVVILAPDGYK